ncbi:hypothetical protein HID58_040725 [Brassica napus]|uniref:(rape) hypothetical protein n=1 Tax=Brassica napus TaxID=3708 RepID=A0A816RB08_BRANA|nr:F-box/kelch-repeat protein At5g39560-like [Brassica napus]KAH0901222.1 hypothetical protein HID58_040725 [Brassica napus]CAF2068847.1 unnamed protein product [Brassica napus]
MIRQDEQPQENKNSNPPPELPPLNLQPHSFSSLPDVIVENILARISKCNYPNLSLVSKRFLSLLSSPELYTTRSRIGTTEPCIYICMERFKDLGLKWYTLWTKHAHVETLTVDDAQEDNLPCNEYSLVPLPESNSLVPFMDRTNVVVGSEIYLFGVTSSEQPSSSVRILDCRSHMWRDGPSMLVARRCPYAVFLDEKIYVFDGCGEDETWMEVLDMKTKTWSPLLRHRVAVLEGGWLNTVGLQGKIYLITKINYCAYDPKQGTWEVVEVHDNLGYLGKWCVSVVEDVMYSYSYYSDNLVWYDSKCKKWIDVKLSNFELLYKWRMVNILNHGGKLLVMWLYKFEEYDGIEVWKIRCAKIVVEKRHGNEVWGEIEWPVTEVKLPELSERFNSLVISI